MSSYPSGPRSFSVGDFITVLDNATVDRQFDKFEVFLAGFSEPLAHREYISFLECCERSPVIDRHVLFTTGYKLKECDLIAMSQMKKLKVNFHVGEIDKMINFDESIWDKLDLIKRYLPDSSFLIVGFSESDFSSVISKLKAKNIECQFQKIINRAGNLKSVGLVQLDFPTNKTPVTCVKLTSEKRPVILPSGLALACCNDYGCKLPIGNLLTQTWADLNFQKIASDQKDVSKNIPCFDGCHFAKKEPIPLKMF